MSASVAVVGTVSVIRAEGNGTCVVVLQGEHDLATAPLLEQETRVICSRCTAAVIDLSEAVFIDSNVVAWLLRVERAREAFGASTLSIVEGPPGSVAARALALFGVRDRLACYATRADALAQRASYAKDARPLPPAIVPC